MILISLNCLFRDNRFFNIKIATRGRGNMTDAEECQYLTWVLRHLEDLMRRTPKDDPLWKFVLDAADTIQDLVEMIRP
jgi:hypothetical protein